MNHLNDAELQELRATLRNDQAELQRHFDLNEQYGLDESLGRSTGELSAYDNHPADLGSELFERGKDIALDDKARHELEQIDQALDRIDREQYGVCSACGEPIPFERLLAVPTTTECVAHAAEHMPFAHARPVEEQVMEHPFGRNSFDERDEETEFDGEDAWQIVESWGTSNTPAMSEDPHVSDYNEMYIEASEQEGYVESLESFLATDIYGGNVTIVRNRAYQDYMDHQEGEPLLEP
ncbi:TraR/DksA C4-type zinc finger protein [Paenibacillus koleovorans]|uniref:TraR/DksA C4-type zinc finger protein n=1 Tax=Paenibacillus koleovorans TaxID=121608 RepID=UPI000FD8E4D4|nr:TraR/DksA C4-type zinc finger protein [Paenibacillus koleovorans]